ncbi:MAG: hypothetical protein JRN37_00595 [Nitrososphaerota archaeon]|nr:hypothetical protein [Nitrososphaerota archaeon]MDG7037650.1 hypothetical protein [Nitrososphaerota archaeon]
MPSPSHVVLKLSLQSALTSSSRKTSLLYLLGRELQVVVGLPEGRAYASQQLHLFHPTSCGHRGSELSGPAPC